MTTKQPDSFDAWWEDPASPYTGLTRKQLAREAWLARGAKDAEICQSYAGTEMYPETLATYIRGLDHE